MGQKGVLGRYPIHFHVIGRADMNQVYVKHCSIHQSFQRCVAIHDSQNILVVKNFEFFLK
jgi:cell surface hyaluronidase